MKLKYLSIILIFATVLALAGCGDPVEKAREESRKDIVKQVEMYLNFVDKETITDAIRENLSKIIQLEINKLKIDKIDDPNMEDYKKLVEYIGGDREIGEIRKIYSALGGK